MAGRFPSEWLNELYARTDIVQVVSNYLPLKKNGGRYWGLCPFHNEKTPSFSVNPEMNVYYCFGCKAGGNVIHFVMEMERLGFQDAAKLLAERAHLPVPELRDDPDYEKRRTQRERLLAANREAAHYYHEALWTDTGKKALEYLYKRGLDDRVIRRFGLGCADEQWDSLYKYLEGKGFTAEEMRLAGLVVQKPDTVFDMFRGRVIFPIVDLQGNVLGFGGRAMGDVQPKYLNTSDTPVFNKRRGVYAVNLLKKLRDLRRVVLVEGYMDVVALSQSGVQGVVATLGTSLTTEQARLLKRFAPEIWVAYDGDEPGQHAIERALDIFESESIPAKVMVFPEGMDPDELVRRDGPEAFDGMKPITGVAFRMMREKKQCDLSTQEGRTEYAKKCAVILNKVREPVELENYLTTLTVETGFSREVLIAQMGVKALEIKNNEGKTRENSLTKRAPRDRENSSAEETLLALLATGRVPAGAVTESAFDNPTLRTLAQGLIEGKSPADLLSEIEDVNILSLAGQVFAGVTENQGDESLLSSVSDCLNAIKIKRITKSVADMNERMRAATDDNEKRAILKDIMTQSAELTRLKKQGR